MRAFIFELIGTFLLVFVGCGALGLSLFYFEILLWQMALLWGAGVALAIYVSRSKSGAQLNPAVSIALVVSGHSPVKKLWFYLAAQFTGAFLAAGALFVLFREAIHTYEASCAYPDVFCQNTGRMFGEYFVQSGIPSFINPTLQAFLLELTGTALLMASIYFWLRKIQLSHWAFPLLIGCTVSLLILCIGPYTQAGINPARDLAPRLFAWFCGWEQNAWANGPLSSLIVYVLGPICGAMLVALLNVCVQEK